MEGRVLLIADLQQLDRENIAEKCLESDKWKKIGLCFEDSHDFVTSYQQLTAKHPQATSADDLVKALFRDLAERGVTIEELAQALEDTRIGLASVAQFLRTHPFKSRHKSKQTNYSQHGIATSNNISDRLTERYSDVCDIDLHQINYNDKNIPKKRRREDKGSDQIYENDNRNNTNESARQLPLIDNPIQHAFSPPESPGVLLDGQQVCESVKKLLDQHHKISIRSTIAPPIAHHYWKWDGQYTVGLWIKEDDLLNQLKSLAAWFRISETEQCNSLQDFANSKLRLKLVQRIGMDRSLVIFYNCYSLHNLQRANLLSIPNSHMIISMQANSDSEDLPIFQPTYDLTWLDEPCKTFIKLMHVQKKNMVPASIICHMPGIPNANVEELKNALKQLADRHLIDFTESDQIIINESLKDLIKYQPDSADWELITTWIDILSATNASFNTLAHNNEKLSFWKLLPCHYIDREDIAKKYLESLIEFLGFMKGEYYFEFYRFQLPISNLPTHTMLVNALINVHIGKPGTDSHAVGKVVLECEKYPNLYPPNFALIAKWCYAQYIRAEQAKASSVDNNHSHVANSNTLLKECMNSLEFKRLPTSHPFVLKVRHCYARNLLEDHETAPRAENELVGCYEKLLYLGVETSSAFTETMTYLAIAQLYNEGTAFIPAVSLLMKSLEAQLEIPELMTRYTFTPITMAALLLASNVEVNNSKFPKELIIKQFQLAKNHQSYWPHVKFNLLGKEFTFSYFCDGQQYFFCVELETIVLLCWKEGAEYAIIKSQI